MKSRACLMSSFESVERLAAYARILERARQTAGTITADQYARASKRKRAHARRASTIQTALQEMSL